MERLAITVMSSAEKTVEKLQSHLATRLGSVLHTVRLETETYSTYSRMACVRSSRGTWSQEKKKTIAESFGRAVADFVQTEQEEKLLRDIISSEHSYRDEEEIRSILSYCRDQLKAEGADLDLRTAESNKRLHELAMEAAQLLEEHEELNLDGFFQFRMKAYLGELHDIVEYAVDEYVMDKQYQEFISLLKYFVYIQDTKIPSVHLMHKGGHEFILLNDQMKPIDTNEPDATFTVEMLDKEFNFEDLIVSTLITVAPHEIIIHTRDPELQVIKTITQIFESRAKLCMYCRSCKPMLGERAARPDQLST